MPTKIRTAEQLHIVYEAGSTGFGLQRDGVEYLFCDVHSCDFPALDSFFGHRLTDTWLAVGLLAIKLSGRLRISRYLPT